MTERGEKEKRALDRLRHSDDDNVCCVGFRDESELKDILTKIANVIPNEQANDFPDFQSEYCFLDHFQITSGSDTRKGAEAIKDDKQYDRKIEKDTKEFLGDPSIQEPKFSAQMLSQNVKHSEENLEKSLYKHFDDHLDSLENCQVTTNQIGVFLIEYDDARLMSFTRQENEPDFPNGRTGYMFQNNINVLRYLKRHKERIQYVIFLKKIGPIEIISLSEIDRLIKVAQSIDQYANEVAMGRVDYSFKSY